MQRCRLRFDIEILNESPTAENSRADKGGNQKRAHDLRKVAVSHASGGNGRRLWRSSPPGIPHGAENAENRLSLSTGNFGVGADSAAPFLNSGYDRWRRAQAMMANRPPTRVG